MATSIAEYEIEHIFTFYFDKNHLAFAEAIADGYDFSYPRFSMDSDVMHVYVDDNDHIVSVHAWDVEEYREMVEKYPKAFNWVNTFCM